MVKIRDVKRPKIAKLITSVNSDKICLPDFQRNFVWTEKQMAKLIESVIRQYPIGTFMFLKSDANLNFGKRSFKETEQETFKPDYYVIDGQQRMLTFYRLLRKPNSFKPFEPIPCNGKNYKIFFKVTTNISNLPFDIDEPSFVIPEKTDEDEIDDYEWQGKERMIPIEFVRCEEYTKKWLKKALGHIKAKNRNKYLRNIHDAKIRIEGYRCVVEKVETKLKPMDHYNMFQLLNSAGTDLTTFDLLVAKLNPIGVDLRKLWAKSQDDFPELKKYDIDPEYVLKVVALIRGTSDAEESGEYDKTIECRQTDLKALYKKYSEKKNNKKLFLEDWDSACNYIEKALNDMRDRYGVVNKRYIPYSPMIVTLAAIKWWFEKLERYDQRFKGNMQRKINWWYWGSIFNNSYSRGTDGKISSHYVALRKWLRPRGRQKEEIKFWLYKYQIQEMIDRIKSSADARYKAIVCLPLTRGAKDIFSKEFLNTKLHDHHIFPRKFLEEHNIHDRDDINNVSNRMLITDKTNQEIKKKSPYDYLKNVKSKELDNHFLFKEIVTKRINFEEFCEKRKKKIYNYINELVNY